MFIGLQRRVLSLWREKQYEITNEGFEMKCIWCGCEIEPDDRCPKCGTIHTTDEM